MASLLLRNRSFSQRLVGQPCPADETYNLFRGFGQRWRHAQVPGDWLAHGFSFGEFARRHVDACADDARFSIHEDSSGVEKIMMLTSIEDGHGWRSAEIGEQTITLIFDQPQPK